MAPENIRGRKGHISVNLSLVFLEEMLALCLDPFIMSIPNQENASYHF